MHPLHAHALLLPHHATSPCISLINPACAPLQPPSACTTAICSPPCLAEFPAITSCCAGSPTLDSLNVCVPEAMGTAVPLA